MYSCFALVSLKVGVRRSGAANSESVKMMMREKTVSGLGDGRTWDNIHGVTSIPTTHHFSYSQHINQFCNNAAKCVCMNWTHVATPTL